MCVSLPQEHSALYPCRDRARRATARHRDVPAAPPGRGGLRRRRHAPGVARAHARASPLSLSRVSALSRALAGERCVRVYLKAVWFISTPFLRDKALSMIAPWHQPPTTEPNPRFARFSHSLSPVGSDACSCARPRGSAAPDCALGKPGKLKANPSVFLGWCAWLSGENERCAL